MDEKQQACAHSSLSLACYFPPFIKALYFFRMGKQILMSNIKGKVTNFFVFVVSVFLSVLLIESVGVNISQANIFSWDTFSFPVFILLGVCIHSAQETITPIAIKLVS